MLLVDGGVSELRREGVRRVFSARTHECISAHNEHVNILCNASEHLGVIIIYHEFLPPPRIGSHVKSDNTKTQSPRHTSYPIYLTPEP